MVVCGAIGCGGIEFTCMGPPTVVLGVQVDTGWKRCGWPLAYGGALIGVVELELWPSRLCSVLMRKNRGCVGFYT